MVAAFFAYKFGKREEGEKKKKKNEKNIHVNS